MAQTAAELRKELFEIRRQRRDVDRQLKGGRNRPDYLNDSRPEAQDANAPVGGARKDTRVVVRLPRGRGAQDSERRYAPPRGRRDDADGNDRPFKRQAGGGRSPRNATFSREEEEKPRKLMSAVVGASALQEEDEKEETKEADEDGEVDAGSKRTASGAAKGRRSISADIMNRNKRMFGSLLMGTLATAKSQLAADRSIDVQRKMTARVEEGIKKTRTEIIAERQKQREENRQKQLEERAVLTKKHQELEAKLLRTTIKEHEEKMLHFIPTKAGPTVFYLPKTHNESTTNALKEWAERRRKEIDSMQVEMLEQTQGDDDKDDEKSDGEDQQQDSAEKAGGESPKDGVGDDGKETDKTKDTEKADAGKADAGDAEEEMEREQENEDES